VGREERASKMLLEIAVQTENTGAKEIAMELRARARAILPPPPAESPAPATSEAQVEIVAYPVIEPSTIVAEPSGNGGSKPTPPSGPIAGAGFDPGAIDLRSIEARVSDGCAVDMDEVEANAEADAGYGIQEEGVLHITYDDAKVAFEMPLEADPQFDLTPVEAEPEAEAEAEPEPGRAADPLPAPGPDAKTRCERAIAEKDWVGVRDIAEEIHEGDPDDAYALENLVFVSKELGDTLATVRYLILLGDLKINEEEFEASLDCFLKVMELDPENVTARRRLARFRDMNVPGAERITEECRNSIQGLLDTDGATVSVKSHGGVESEEWFDLSALLQEFREGAAKQIDPNDAEGHYDLGLSHHEMGLYEEAVEEFGIILASKGITLEMELKAREMHGECLERLERYREAIHEYRVALESDGLPERKRVPLLYRLACSLEAVGERDEALAIFKSLSAGETPFLDTRTHLDRLGG
jgi:tetratricopeptide (TPR) repeat protein